MDRNVDRAVTVAGACVSVITSQDSRDPIPPHFAVANGCTLKTTPINSHVKGCLNQNREDWIFTAILVQTYSPRILRISFGVLWHVCFSNQQCSQCRQSAGLILIQTIIEPYAAERVGLRHWLIHFICTFLTPPPPDRKSHWGAGTLLVGLSLLSPRSHNSIQPLYITVDKEWDSRYCWTWLINEQDVNTACHQTGQQLISRIYGRTEEINWGWLSLRFYRSS
jgi:hypothetical protein